MNPIALILSMAAASYSTRIAGFVARGRALPERIERFLAFVPIAAFAALIATGLDAGAADGDARLLAIVPAAVIAVRWKRLWLTLTGGMVCYWIAGYLL